MCDIASLRDEIHIFLCDLVRTHDISSADGLAACKEAALQKLTATYEGACPDQCIEARVDGFFNALNLDPADRAR